MVRRRLASVLGLGGLFVAAVLAQTPAQQPVFRAGVDLVELDVSVFDKDRHPIRGLVASDFTVFEDSQPRRVEVFAPVDLPDPPPVTAEWMKAPPVDVDSNDVTSGRLFLIVLDDQNLHTKAAFSTVSVTEPAAATARRVIESLGPNDLGAVVFTDKSWNGQGFTADKARLMAAVDTMGPEQDGRPVGRVPASTTEACAFREILRDATDALKSIPHRRKFIVFISAGGGCTPEMLMAGQDGFLITGAQAADINVYAIAPTIIDPMIGGGAFMNAIAEPTGGRAILTTNDPVSEVSAIFDENRSYYMVGFISENLKNRDSLKRVEVKVDRPGVTVRSRSLYDAPSAAPPKASKKPPPSPALAAIADIVPKPDLPLRATAAAVAAAPGNAGLVAVVIGVREPDGAPAAEDRIDVTVRAFDPDGKERGNDREIATMPKTPSTTAGSVSGVEVLSRLTLPPGRYSLRIAAHSQATGHEGSVYTDVQVPDFAHAALSLSEVSLSASGGPAAAPTGLLSTMLPVPPTAERQFSRAQTLTAFARVFQGGTAIPAAVTMRTHVVDDHDAVVLDRHEIVPAAVFASTRSADYRTRLPDASWHPGAYLVSVSAAIGAHVESRDIRVDIR